MKSLTLQGGSAHLFILSLIILLGSYGTLQHMNRLQAGQTDLHQRLLLAKEALIARAVTDANRPGSLPCPDLITDDKGLSNHPNDGKSDNLTRNDCPSYIGWLPWVTLDLPELTDNSGTRLWYVLSRSLRDDDAAQPINSDTSNTLTLDNREDIAALIIAPGAAINGQQRPGNAPADFLEADNALAGNRYINGPGNNQFNDVILALTRQELMAAVEKRVAAELHSCLEQHATASANLRQEYPWPSPFSAANGRGQAGSYFGQVPLNQPGNGPQAQLLASQKSLQDTRNSLATASNPAAQMTALNTLNEHLAFAKIFYDRLYTSARDLALAANSLNSQFIDLDQTLIAANSNGRISVTERRNIQSDGEQVRNQLSTVQTLLQDFGMDIFPAELSARQNILQAQIELATASPGSNSLAALSTASNTLLFLFNHSQTRNTGIGQSLNNARAIAAESLSALQQALAAPSDGQKTGAALALSRALQTAADQVQTSISNNRIGLHPDEVRARIDALIQTLDLLKKIPNPENQNALRTLLQETDGLIRRINTGSSDLQPRLSNSLNALGNALSASNTINNIPLVISSTQEAISQAGLLHQSMRSHGDNLTQESLNSNYTAFLQQLNTFNSVVTRTQAELVPYAENLRLAAVNLQFWSEILHRQVGNIALQARKAPEASKTQSNPASAYSQADLALSGINKSGGTLSKLQDALDNPNSTSKQNTAKTTLADTLDQVDKLLQTSNSLSQALRSSEADAFPMLWYGSRCAFLQPGSDNTSWWLANQWSHTTFFQISQRLRGDEGRLSVDAQGRYHSVVINSGQPLAGQNRQVRQSSSFLESINADNSRDGSANSPRTNFISRAVSPDFNDRLAF